MMVRGIRFEFRVVSVSLSPMNRDISKEFCDLSCEVGCGGKNTAHASNNLLHSTPTCLAWRVWQEACECRACAVSGG